MKNRNIKPTLSLSSVIKIGVVKLPWHKCKLESKNLAAKVIKTLIYLQQMVEYEYYHSL